jgi:dynein heavy chain
VKQVQKNSSIIEQVMYAIAGAEIVTEPPHPGDVLDLQVGGALRCPEIYLL